MSQPYRVLVTGSREWDDRQAIEDALWALARNHPAYQLTVVHGDCPRGADRMAHNWASSSNGSYRAGVYVDEEPHPADWDRYGKSAGFRRNAEMVALGADLCLAFIKAGSRGATHCADLAEKAGIETRRFT